MVDVSLYALQTFHREGVCLGEDALCAIVLIFTIFILKVYGVARGNNAYLYAELAQVGHGLHVRRGKRGDEVEIFASIEVVHGVGKVVGCASRHIDFGLGSDNLIVRDVPDAAYIVHLFLTLKACKVTNLYLSKRALGHLYAREAKN